MTACTNTFEPSSRRMIVTSICSNSPIRWARIPIRDGLGWILLRGLRHPFRRLIRAYVDAEANTRPIRLAWADRVLTGLLKIDEFGHRPHARDFVAGESAWMMFWAR